MLLEVECKISLDRHLKRKLLHDDNYVNLPMQWKHYIDFITITELDSEILQRAGEPFFLPLGTLDALHPYCHPETDFTCE